MFGQLSIHAHSLDGLQAITKDFSRDSYYLLSPRLRDPLNNVFDQVYIHLLRRLAAFIYNHLLQIDGVSLPT